MASAELFKGLPSFPEDVPIAAISRISLSKLVSGNESEAKALLDACRNVGFFLLDLAGDLNGEKMIREVDAMFKVVQNTMHLSLEEKMKYHVDPPRDSLGYKAEGLMKTEIGVLDNCEFFTVSQDEILGNTTARHALPATIHTERLLLKSYLVHCQSVLSHILHALEIQLGLPRATFRKLQPLTTPSRTVLRMTRYLPAVSPEDRRVPLPPHTDYGSVTLLANVLGGLQILRPDGEPEDESAWECVQPQPGCIIVNLGDAMVGWTCGVLRSNLYRVGQAPGQQRYAERFGFAMLVRPDQEASMKRLVGGQIPDIEEDREEGSVPKLWRLQIED